MDFGDLGKVYAVVLVSEELKKVGEGLEIVIEVDSLVMDLGQKNVHH